MAGVRRGAFTCVGWQVTLCDPIWQVTSRSSEMGFPRPLPFTFNNYTKPFNFKKIPSSLVAGFGGVFLVPVESGFNVDARLVASAQSASNWRWSLTGIDWRSSAAGGFTRQRARGEIRAALSTSPCVTGYNVYTHRVTSMEKQ